MTTAMMPDAAHATRVDESLRRGEALAQAMQVIDNLARLASREGGPSYVQDVRSAWDARLRTASERNSEFYLPADVSSAVTELMASAESLGTDWVELIDLVARNILDLVDVQPIALQPTVHAASTETRANLFATATWAESPRHQRLTDLAAA
jgi:hypothetical protein